MGPGVSWGKGQVRKCPGGQRRPGVAGLVERDSFGRREPLPLRGPRVCKAEMLRPASGSERSLSPGSPLMAAGLAAPSKRPGWRQARRLNTSRDSSGLGQAQRVLSPNCYAASSWTTPGQQGRRLTAQQTHQSSRRYSIKRLPDLHSIFYERNLFPSDEAHSNFIPPGEQRMSCDS